MTARTSTMRAALLLTLVAAICCGLQAQDRMAKPASGFRADFIGQISQVEHQITGLEGAVPQEKFSWRPAEGVRSIGEVYLHVAFGNYIILKLSGYEPPASANFVTDLMKWDSQTTDKAKIASIMKDSFEHVRAVATKVSDADLEKEVNVFGTKMTLRGAMMVTLSHLHEHLGQSIAYARMNGIVPPWTAAEHKAEAEKKK